MNHQSIESELIMRYTKELKLPTVKDCLEDIVAEASNKGWEYRKFLAELLQREVWQRYENRKYIRIRKAGFPQMKYLHELIKEELPADGRGILPEVETLEFIREGRNFVIYGNPSTRKTHIAIGLGIKACMEGYSVFFTTVPHLLTLIRVARTDKTLQQLENRFRKYDLVICDEMGYVGFD